MKHTIKTILKATIFVLLLNITFVAKSQINTDQVMNIGRNALYFEDYILSIQYFNQVIKVKPYLAEPYFFRSIAKLQLEDYSGAEEDASLAIERNPFIVDAYQVRGIARQSLGEDTAALKDYEAGLEQFPQSKVFLLNKAVVEETLKQYDNSLESYNKLISLYPAFEKGYLGRAQLYLAKGDTVKSINDIDKSILLDKNNSNAYVLRANIYIKQKNNLDSALNDMNEAIKLEPNYAGFFINRAYVKYHLDDYYGAMADYDYAIALSPDNITARFNRGLMLAEVADNDKAIADFSFVIEQEPNNVIARYNRAELYAKAGRYKKAIADYDVVINEYPTFGQIYFVRSECKRKSGDRVGGEKDYNRFRDLTKRNEKIAEYDEAKASEKPTQEEDIEEVKGRFKNLLTIESESPVKPEYESKTRGKIQDNNVRIDPEPQFILSFYEVKDDVRNDTRFTRELTEINESRLLSYMLVLSNNTPYLSEEAIAKQFKSIEYYNSYIAGSQKRSIDYFGRAIDYLMVKNPKASLEDLNKAIDLSPKFTLAYFARANAKYSIMEMDSKSREYTSAQTGGDDKSELMLQEKKDMQYLMDVISDLDKVIELSPKMVYAYFNKANSQFQLKDFTSAISTYSKAIELKPDFGEAYYNRGLVYFQLGNRAKGIADLSKAGELGITPSYNVLKRMSK